MEAHYDVLAPVHENTVRDRALAALRREAPIQWDPENQWWLVTRHADILHISRHPEIFSSEPKGPWHVFEHRFSMQAMDGKAHLRHRNIVSRAFTPRMVSLSLMTPLVRVMPLPLRWFPDVFHSFEGGLRLRKKLDIFDFFPIP